MPTACLLAVCLHLVNVSSASPATVAAAEHDVAAMYASIGVPIRWTDDADAMLLIVRDDEPGTLRRASQPILGVAIRAAQGSPAAYVFYRRAAAQAERDSVPAATVIAAAMAHEIGHLLLPASGHAHRGLMRACWDHDDLVNAARGDLRFSPEQAASIRAIVGR